MTANTENIVFKQALSLAPVERAELIEVLFHSFDQNRHTQNDLRWVQEAESRIEGYDAGKIEASSMEAVFDRINRR